MFKFWFVVARCSSCSAFCTTVALASCLHSGDTGYGSRRFRRRARLRTALGPEVPMYSRGSGGTVVIQYVDYGV